MASIGGGRSNSECDNSGVKSSTRNAGDDLSGPELHYKQASQTAPYQFEEFVKRELAQLTNRLVQRMVQEHQLILHETRAIDLHRIAALRVEVRELRRKVEKSAMGSMEYSISAPQVEYSISAPQSVRVLDWEYLPVPREWSPALPRTAEHARGSNGVRSMVPQSPVTCHTPKQHTLEGGGDLPGSHHGATLPSAHGTENNRANDINQQIELGGCTNNNELEHSIRQFNLWPCWSMDPADSPTNKTDHGQISLSVTFPGTEDYYNLDIEPDHIVSFGHSRCVIRPSSKGKITWDLVGVLVMMWDILMIPLQVFDLPDSGALNVVAITTTTYWMLDVILNFNVGYYSNKGLLIMQREKIARKYLKTWFALDVLIVTIDIFLVIDTQTKDADKDNPMETTGIIRFGKAFKILRMIRVIRLFRLRKIRNLFVIIQDIVDSERMDIIVGILRNMSGVMMVNHFLACIWWWIGNTRVQNFDSWPEVYKMMGQSWEWCYLTSFHWSITQFTPASMNVQPQNVAERMYALAVILLAMVMFSSFVSSVTNGMNRLWSLKSRQNQELWLFRKYLRQNEISRQLTVRLNRYIQVVLETQKKELCSQNVKVISLLSEPLYLELQTELFLKHLVVHPLFSHMQAVTPNIIRMLCSDVIVQKSLSRGDILVSAGERARSMYFLIRGLMMYQPAREGAVPVPFHTQQWCSEAPLWTPWKHLGVVRAKFECEIIALEAVKFQDVVTQHQLNMRAIISYGSTFVQVLNQILNGEIPGNMLLSDIQIDMLGCELMVEFLYRLSGSISLNNSIADQLLHPSLAAAISPKLLRIPHLWTRSYPAR